MVSVAWRGAFSRKSMKVVLPSWVRSSRKPLRGHNNVQGASDHGAMPNFFPGYQKVDDPAIRAKFEKAWNVTLPPKPGLNNHLMIDAIHDGRLKAMYVFGEEMSIVDSNANYVAAALSKLDFRSEERRGG